jgi:hypothetical protein
MGFVRGVVWTVGAVALGAGLTTVEIGGKTALAHARKAWERAEAGEWLKDRAEDAVDRARGALGQPQQPRERHSDEDRAALERIIAKRGGSGSNSSR